MTRNEVEAQSVGKAYDLKTLGKQWILTRVRNKKKMKSMEL